MKMSLLGLDSPRRKLPKLVLVSLVCCGKGNHSTPELGGRTRELEGLGS